MELSQRRHDMKEVGMFLNECTACGREQLIFLSQVSAYDDDQPWGRGALHLLVRGPADLARLAGCGVPARSSLIVTARRSLLTYLSRERATRSCGSTVAGQLVDVERVHPESLLAQGVQAGVHRWPGSDGRCPDRP